MDVSTAVHTHLLGTYKVAGRERQLLALEADDTRDLHIVDVLVKPVDGDDDVRAVEACVPDLGECQSIADDYIALGTELGVPPMPSAWW